MKKRPETRDQGPGAGGAVTGRSRAFRFTYGTFLHLLGFFAAIGLGAARAEMPAEKPTLIVAVGAAGAPEFATDFSAQAETWRKVAKQAAANFILVGSAAEPADESNAAAAGEATDRARLKQAIDAEAKEGPQELWLVLIGHGTFDGREAKFNLRGPDVSASELAEWLAPVQRPMAVVDTASASAPFLAKLAGPRRVVVTSTRSGYELNYARFGKYFAEAMADLASDLDKDGQVSLLEGFLTASHRTNEFYKTAGRLATEHALLDDNGDGLGTPADWFRGVRAIKRARDGAALDGLRAGQMTLVRSAAERQLSAEMRARRDEIELQIAELREMKPKLAEPAYFRELERLLLELAALYEGT